jgi:hypothetical protein
LVSIKLVAEVLDHYHGPFVRKLWLVALAEVAHDETRSGWCPRSVLADRVGVSQTRATHIASDLVAEGVIKRDGGGHRGRTAVYVIANLNGQRVQPRRTLWEPDEDVPWLPKGAHWAHPIGPRKGAR